MLDELLSVYKWIRTLSLRCWCGTCDSAIDQLYCDGLMSAKISEKQGIQMIMKRDVADHQFICWSCVTLARFTSFNDRKGSENMVLSAGQEVGTNHPRGSSRNMCDVFFSFFLFLHARHFSSRSCKTNWWQSYVEMNCWLIYQLPSWSASDFLVYFPVYIIVSLTCSYSLSPS